MNNFNTIIRKVIPSFVKCITILSISSAVLCLVLNDNPILDKNSKIYLQNKTYNDKT